MIRLVLKNVGFQILFPQFMQKSTKDTTLDVGEDRLVLHVNPSKYHLDLDLPFDVNNEICGAQYNRKTKVGTLGMDVMKPQT